jgi:hypothetical protein
MEEASRHPAAGGVWKVAWWEGLLQPATGVFALVIIGILILLWRLWRRRPAKEQA